MTRQVHGAGRHGARARLHRTEPAWRRRTRRAATQCAAAKTRGAHVFFGILVGAAIQQQPHDLQMAVKCRPAQRRQAILRATAQKQRHASAQPTSSHDVRRRRRGAGDEEAIRRSGLHRSDVRPRPRATRVSAAPRAHRPTSHAGAAAARWVRASCAQRRTCRCSSFLQSRLAPPSNAARTAATLPLRAALNRSFSIPMARCRRATAVRASVAAHRGGVSGPAPHRRAARQHRAARRKRALAENRPEPSAPRETCAARAPTSPAPRCALRRKRQNQINSARAVRRGLAPRARRAAARRPPPVRVITSRSLAPRLSASRTAPPHRTALRNQIPGPRTGSETAQDRAFE
jgi:hypothetical protein